MDIWYEVFIDKGQELGTETLRTFKKLKEARTYKKNVFETIKKEETLHIDMWENPAYPNKLKDIE